MAMNGREHARMMQPDRLAMCAQISIPLLGKPQTQALGSEEQRSLR